MESGESGSVNMESDTMESDDDLPSESADADYIPDSSDSELSGKMPSLSQYQHLFVMTIPNNESVSQVIDY